MGLFRQHSIGYSIIVHVAIGSVLFIAGTKALKRKNPGPEITVLLQDRTHRSNQPQHAAIHVLQSAHGSHLGQKPSYRLDLRPSFAKSLDGISHVSPSQSASSSKDAGVLGENQEAQDLLHADGMSLQAFDQLALMINGHLDYPVMLAENGIHGMATIDLYFDHDAQIDESRSQVLGDSRWIRGLFVQAARVGISDWLRGMGSTLKKEQFRDQHFRADFVITFTSTRSSELEKNGENSYHLVRRSLVQTCLNPAMGGVDITCAAMRVAGVISSKLSSDYKIKFEALKDRLEQFDDLGLTGIKS